MRSRNGRKGVSALQKLRKLSPNLSLKLTDTLHSDNESSWDHSNCRLTLDQMSTRRKIHFFSLMGSLSENIGNFANLFSFVKGSSKIYSQLDSGLTIWVNWGNPFYRKNGPQKLRKLSEWRVKTFNLQRIIKVICFLSFTFLWLDLVWLGVWLRFPVCAHCSASLARGVTNWLFIRSFPQVTRFYLLGELSSYTIEPVMVIESSADNSKPKWIWIYLGFR